MSKLDVLGASEVQPTLREVTAVEVQVGVITAVSAFKPSRNAKTILLFVPYLMSKNVRRFQTSPPIPDLEISLKLVMSTAVPWSGDGTSKQCPFPPQSSSSSF